MRRTGGYVSGFEAITIGEYDQVGGYYHEENRRIRCASLSRVDEADYCIVVNGKCVEAERLLRK